MNEEQLLRDIGYGEYPEDTPVEERRGDPRCIVSHPDAFAEGHTGPCGEPATMELWAMPFCPRHGEEAKLAALEELIGTVDQEFQVLYQAESNRHYGDQIVMSVLKAAPEHSLTLTDGDAYEAAARAAYPPEELAGNIDADTLAFDYNDYGMSVPPDWWHDELTLLCRFMRQAYTQGGLLAKHLEPLRERAAVQRLLADRDFKRRYAAPMRANS